MHLTVIEIRIHNIGGDTPLGSVKCYYIVKKYRLGVYSLKQSVKFYYIVQKTNYNHIYIVT
jgi:hypothetical protein